MRRAVAFYDTECFPSYWLLKVKLPDGSVLKFELRAGQNFDPTSAAIIADLFASYTTVSCNGNYYDVSMICAAINGYSCEQLKWLSDRLIVEGLKPWQTGLPEWKPADHIDILELCPGVWTGQKTYAGRIHCKLMLDLPYDPGTYLTEPQIAVVDDYCGNDLGVLEELFNSLAPQLQQREELSKRYGIDLRSKSDAQLAETVLKHRCEQALGYRIYKPEIDWNLNFRYEPPAWLAFQNPQLQQALAAVSVAIFSLSAKGTVEMPEALSKLTVTLGSSTYRLGIGGLHSSEKTVSYKSSETHQLRDVDVASYYPKLILNSGRWPKALGPAFLQEYSAIIDERLAAKALEKTLPKGSPEWTQAHCENEGGKIMINGTFGKTGSPYSILFAPEMLIQTTVTGQLALLMLIEWHEHYGIPVVSANTDGIVINCPRSHLATSEALITEWQRRTGLEMEASDYAALYSRDVNNYVAVKSNGETKRKGEYSKAGLVEKKNPDCEICGDAVSEYLSKGTPLLVTILGCADIRKFVKIQKVAGGAVKLWGEGPIKGAKVSEMVPMLEAHGWEKEKRKWFHKSWRSRFDTPGMLTAHEAYLTCFSPQRPEFMGKVIRWYYSTQAPGPIIYNTTCNTVGNSYGAKPCMTLPDTLPDDIDYAWYLQTATAMLADMGVQL